MVSIKVLNQVTNTYDELELDKTNISFSKKNNYFVFNEVEYGYSANFKIYKTAKNEKILKCPELTNNTTNSMIYKQKGVLIVDGCYNLDINFYILSSTPDYYNCTILLYPGEEMDLITNTKVKDQLLSISEDDDDIHSIFWSTDSDNEYFKYANDEHILKINESANNKYLYSVIPYASNARREDINDKKWCFLPSLNIRVLLDKLIGSLDWEYVDVSNLFTAIENQIYDITSVPYQYYNTAYWHWLISDIISNEEAANTIEYTFNMSEGLPTFNTTYPIRNTKDTHTYDDFPEVENLYGAVTYYGGWYNNTPDIMKITIPPELDGYIMLFKGEHNGHYATEHIFWNVKNPWELMTDSLADQPVVNTGDVISIEPYNYFMFVPKNAGYWDTYKFYPVNDPNSPTIIYPRNHGTPAAPVGPKRSRFNVSYTTSPTLIYYLPKNSDSPKPGDIINPLSSCPDVTIMELLKLYAYLTNSQIVFQTKAVDEYSNKKYELKLIKENVTPTTICLDDKFIKKTEEKRFVNNWSKTNRIGLCEEELEDEDYVPNYPITENIYVNSTDIVDSEKTIEYEFNGGDSIGESIQDYYVLNDVNIPSNSGTLFVKDCSDYKENSNDFEYDIKVDRPTVGYSYMSKDYPMLFQESNSFYSVPDMIRRNSIYSDVIDTNSYIKVNVRYSLLDYMNIQYNTMFILRGKLYVWFNAQYSNNVCTLSLQEISNYPVTSWPINISIIGGGTVSGNGLYFEGTEGIQLVATPFEGNQFLYWLDEDHNIVDDDWPGHWTFNNDGTITMAPIMQDYWFTAVFTNDKYRISASVDPSNATAIHLMGAGSYYAGDTCSLWFYKDERDITYEFLGWYENGSLVSESSHYSFVVSRDRNLVAKFKVNRRFYLALSTNLPNFSQVIGTGYYDDGTSAMIRTFTFAPDQYQFLYWEENGEMYYNQPICPVLMNSNRHLTAIYSSLGSNIVVETNEPKGCTVSGGGFYNQGQNYTISCVLVIGYNFDGWYEGETLVSSNLSQQFTADGQNHTYTAKVHIDRPTVSIEVDPSGAGTTTGSGTYSHGDTVTVTATPNTRYIFLGWYNENDQLVESNSSYTFVIYRDRRLTAKFASTFVVTTEPLNQDARTRGTVTGGGTYNNGDTCTLTAISDRDYTFAGWTINGLVVRANPYSFTVTSDITVYYNFDERESRV